MSTNQIAKRDEKADAVIRQMIRNVNVQERFKLILGERANAFLSTVATVASSPALVDADPNSIMSAAIVAATLDLPIDPNLGQSAIVPYNVYDKATKTSVKKAQFQVMKRGFIQLAHRTSQYRTINSLIVYEGMLKKHDVLTGEIILNPESERKSDRIIGAVAYIELINGFRKSLYMTKSQLDAHGQKFSKSFGSEFGQWKKDAPAMYEKTVLKRLLSHYGILSVGMQTAIKMDQAVVSSPDTSAEITDFDVVYPDNPSSDTGPVLLDADHQREPGEEPQELFVKG